MIDLHCHILPGIDDGPPDMEASVALASAASANGIETIVATPHIREDHPFPPETLPERVAELNDELSRREVPVLVVAGAEVALSTLDRVDDAMLDYLMIGAGPYMLVESPYSPVGELLEATLFDLQVRGVHPVLAHPERSPCFLGDLERARALVERDILCSVTADSMTSRFGRTIKRFTADLFEAELVHSVASDAHDAERRGPRLRHGFSSLEKDVRGLRAQMNWLTRDVPQAMLAGETLPARPQRFARRRLRRFVRPSAP